MNRYQRLANLCSRIAEAFIEGEAALLAGADETEWPMISTSNDGKRIDVVWNAFAGMSHGDRSELIWEAQNEAFGDAIPTCIQAACGFVSLEEKREDEAYQLKRAEFQQGQARLCAKNS